MPNRTVYQPAVRLFPGSEALGAAAADVGDALKRRLDGQAGVRMVFASAPSQAATLRHLAERPGIDWIRVTAIFPVGQADSGERAITRPGGKFRRGPAGCQAHQSHDGAPSPATSVRASLAAATTSAPNRMI